jgi:putative transposase
LSKSFPIQEDGHFLIGCRYVERNALKAGVVERAEEWRWGSLWARRQGGEQLRALLSDWPLERPRNWLASTGR